MQNIWYYGTDKPVQKFLYSLIGKNNNKRITNYYGWGMTFIDKPERAKSYGKNILEIHIKEGIDILDGFITKNQLEKITKTMVSDGFKLTAEDVDSIINCGYGEYSVMNDVWEFYLYLMRLGERSFKPNYSNKDVSGLLLRSGIDGMIQTNDVGDVILVVFNEDVIEIKTDQTKITKMKKSGKK